MCFWWEALMDCTGRCAKLNKPGLILVHGNENPLIANSLITLASCVLLVPGTTYFKYKLQNYPERLKALKKSWKGEIWVLSGAAGQSPCPGSLAPWWDEAADVLSATEFRRARDCVCRQQLASARREVIKEQHFSSVYGNVIYLHPTSFPLFCKL